MTASRGSWSCASVGIPSRATTNDSTRDTCPFGGQRDALTYKQLGNGVNTGVVWNVLRAHTERDRNQLLDTPTGAAIYGAISSAPADPKARIAESSASLGQARQPSL